MEIQTINLAADTPQTFLIPGKFLEIIEAPYPFSIAFFDRNGNALADGGLVNVESGLFVDLRDGGGWGSIVVTSALAQTVKLLIGSMMGGSRRQPGVVQVVDGGRARTQAGVAFSGFAFQSAVAAEFSRVQLWNPVGSNKRVTIERVTPLGSTTNLGGHGVVSAAALTTLDQVGQSKLSGGTASVMECRRATTATPSAPPILFAWAVLAFTVQPLPANPVSPIVLLPGQGLVLFGTTVNIPFGATFEWVEEVI